ncbi:S8 family serine peptidase [Polycladomyces subterraneus]|nr:S8 family serine peptidase [Polycladomyces subterraneus]
MRSRTRVLFAVLLAVLLTVTGVSVPASAWYDPSSDQTVVRSGEDGYYFVELSDPAIAEYNGGIQGYAKTKPEAGHKISIQSEAVQSYANRLKSEQDAVKNWLRRKAPKARVVTEYEITLNGLAVKTNGTDPSILRQAPGVKRVVKSIKYRPAMDVSHEIINDIPMWKSGYDGKGIKVAVIDSGIDAKHPFLTDPDLKTPEGFPKGDTRFTSKKVIVARVYSPDPTKTPEAIDSHGTHVSGTIAGIANYQDPSGVATKPLSGVAPKAYLGNYNVFPCSDCEADSIYIAKAVEDAVRDGMDVANLSLGGPAEPGFDLLAEVVNAAVDAGMVTVISAGNEGPGPMTIGSPGTADKVITVAAVTNKHFIGLPIKVTVDGVEKTLPAGSSAPGGQIQTRVAAPLAVVTDDNGTACQGITADLTGKIAVIKRGGCTFTQKAAAAQEKGAVGVILINNTDGDPTAMLVEESVTIPMVMVSMNDGDWILKGQSASAVLEPLPEREFLTTNDSYIANFSSRGPTVNYTLKPDVAAVGVNVYSSVVGGGLASYNGTSMSAPHVAGAAALLQQAHPDWTPQDIKAALIGTGRDPKSAANPLEVGGGIIDVAAANKPVALANPASLSFKIVPPNGQNSSKTMQVTVKNTTKTKQTYYIIVDNKGNVKTSATYLTVNPGAEGTFKVTVSGKGKTVGLDYTGYITLLAKNGKKIRIPYHYRVDHN